MRDQTPQDHWQPIETAPKDGTPVLVFDEFYRDKRRNASGVAEWSVGWKKWCWSDPAACDEYPANGPIEPTHWQPVPEPPQPKGDQ